MRSLISAGLAAALVFALGAGLAAAYSPSIAQLDALARAAGNRRDIAEHIGAMVFKTHWPAEVSQISANELSGHLLVGIRILGVKFHRAMTREEFAKEVVTLVESAFSAAPALEEVDLWASVPITVPKGVIVSGDLAKPTSRTVFSVSTRRGESAATLQDRILHVRDGVFWDPAWMREAFAQG